MYIKSLIYHLSSDPVMCTKLIRLQLLKVPTIQKSRLSMFQTHTIRGITVHDAVKGGGTVVIREMKSIRGNERFDFCFER